MYELLLQSPENEFRAFLDGSLSVLDAKETQNCATLAKEFLANNFLYALAPRSRLQYIQELLEEKSLEDFTETVDSHKISALMQFVYGVDMSLDKRTAFGMLLAPLLLGDMERQGLLNIENGRIFLPEEALEKAKLNLPPEMRSTLEAQIVNMQRDSKTGEISPDSFNKNFEDFSFGLAGELHVPEELWPNIEILRQKYFAKLGKPEKVGRYICPFDKKVLEFCSDAVERETGKKLPSTEVLVDYLSRNPYNANGKIILPPVALSDKFALVQCFVAELPHIMPSHYDETRIDDFVKDKKGFFKVHAWSEGSPLRLQEIATRDFAKTFGQLTMSDENFGFVWMSGIAKKGIILEPFLHPVLLKQYDIETILDFSVYHGMAYPFGWHFVRKLDRETYKGLLDAEKPWESRALGWNGPLKKPDRKVLKDIYNVERNTSLQTYEQILGEHTQTLARSFSAWESEYLKK